MEQVPRRWSLAEARSAPLKRLATEVEHVGNVPFPVLILGRRGAGKTHVAALLRAKHLEYLGRAVPSGPWEFRLNCALFRGELLQSELFGHEKGSFTGALKQHIGIYLTTLLALASSCGLTARGSSPPPRS